MQGVPLPAPESDREIRLLTREVYYDKLAVKERFIRINLKGDGRWKSCLTGDVYKRQAHPGGFGGGWCGRLLPGGGAAEIGRGAAGPEDGETSVETRLMQ